ncbi:MAG TPA: RNA methyltransferase [Bacteroidales bacterium]|nr:RNA methyltransferase [Bacteroidales bacterium]
MISTGKIKLIRSLHQKKQREKLGLFIIEGDKLVREFLTSNAQVVCVVAKPEWLASLPEKNLENRVELIEVESGDLKKVSRLTSPQNALALVRIPEHTYDTGSLKSELSIALESVQDPGNLGTIIRIAAWYGIKNLFCSDDCVDIFNSKVIQSSMGAVLHVKTHYTDLADLLTMLRKSETAVYSASLNGESVYTTDLERGGIIIFGNESRGITTELKKFVNKELTIPSFGEPGAGIDSLNVAMSAAIICSEFRRRQVSGQ